MLEKGAKNIKNVDRGDSVNNADGATINSPSSDYTPHSEPTDGSKVESSLVTTITANSQKILSAIFPKGNVLFEKVEVIGRGGVGEAYKLSYSHDGESHAVVIKFPTTSSGVSSMEREIAVYKELEYIKDVIPFFYGAYSQEDFGINSLGAIDTRKKCIAVIGFLEGEDLSNVIEKRKNETITGINGLNQIIKIATQLSDVLSRIHANGVIVRDVKPSNVRVCPDDSVKIFDFGGSAIEGNLAYGTSSAVTPMYVDPALIDMSAISSTVDPANDVYSLGCIIYELITGEGLFDSRLEIQQLFAKKMDSITERIGLLTRKLDKDTNIEGWDPNYLFLATTVKSVLTGLVENMLLKNPARRCSAKEVSNILKVILDVVDGLSSYKSDRSSASDKITQFSYYSKLYLLLTTYPIATDPALATKVVGERNAIFSNIETSIIADEKTGLFSIETLLLMSADVKTGAIEDSVFDAVLDRMKDVLKYEEGKFVTLNSSTMKQFISLFEKIVFMPGITDGQLRKLYELVASEISCDREKKKVWDVLLEKMPSGAVEEEKFRNVAGTGESAWVFLTDHEYIESVTLDEDLRYYSKGDLQAIEEALREGYAQGSCSKFVGILHAAVSDFTTRARYVVAMQNLTRKLSLEKPVQVDYDIVSENTEFLENSDLGKCVKNFVESDLSGEISDETENISAVLIRCSISGDNMFRLFESNQNVVMQKYYLENAMRFYKQVINAWKKLDADSKRDPGLISIYAGALACVWVHAGFVGSELTMADENSIASSIPETIPPQEQIEIYEAFLTKLETQAGYKKPYISDLIYYETCELVGALIRSISGLQGLEERQMKIFLKCAKTVSRNYLYRETDTDNRMKPVLSAFPIALSSLNLSRLEWFIPESLEILEIAAKALEEINRMDSLARGEEIIVSAALEKADQNIKKLSTSKGENHKKLNNILVSLYRSAIAFYFKSSNCNKAKEYFDKLVALLQEDKRYCLVIEDMKKYRDKIKENGDSSEPAYLAMTMKTFGLKVDGEDTSADSLQKSQALVTAVETFHEQFSDSNDIISGSASDITSLCKAAVLHAKQSGAQDQIKRAESVQRTYSDLQSVGQPDSNATSATNATSANTNSHTSTASEQNNLTNISLDNRNVMQATEVTLQEAPYESQPLLSTSSLDIATTNIPTTASKLPIVEGSSLMVAQEVPQAIPPIANTQEMGVLGRTDAEQNGLVDPTEAYSNPNIDLSEKSNPLGDESEEVILVEQDSKSPVIPKEIGNFLDNTEQFSASSLVLDVQNLGTDLDILKSNGQKIVEKIFGDGSSFVDIKELSHGAHGIVYKIDCTVDGVSRAIVLKLPFDDPSVGSTFDGNIANMYREIAIYERIDNKIPEIPHFYGAFSLDDFGLQLGNKTSRDKYVLVLEFIHGDEIDVNLKKSGDLFFEGIISVSAQVSGILEALHNTGIAICDLKSDSIRIVVGSNMPEVRLFDFSGGVIKDDVTYGTSKMGTKEYASPERFSQSGTRGFDKRNKDDVYALAIILYKLILGGSFVVPVQGQETADYIKAKKDRWSSETTWTELERALTEKMNTYLNHDTEVSSDRSFLVGAVKDVLMHVIKKCLNPSSDEQYSSAEIHDILKTLSAVLAFTKIGSDWTEKAYASLCGIFSKYSIADSKSALELAKHVLDKNKNKTDDDGVSNVKNAVGVLRQISKQADDVNRLLAADVLIDYYLSIGNENQAVLIAHFTFYKLGRDVIRSAGKEYDEYLKIADLIYLRNLDLSIREAHELVDKNEEVSNRMDEIIGKINSVPHYPDIKARLTKVAQTVKAGYVQAREKAQREISEAA